MRLEQIYPRPTKALKAELTRFKGADWVWCQEEPKNQGAWSFVEPELEAILTEIGAKKTRFAYAGRKASASPATGLASRHKYEQETLVKEALG
jgi:2-oxoglutarate dehydrogenase E1 component